MKWVACSNTCGWRYIYWHSLLTQDRSNSNTNQWETEVSKHQTKQSFHLSKLILSNVCYKNRNLNNTIHRLPKQLYRKEKHTWGTLVVVSQLEAMIFLTLVLVQEYSPFCHGVEGVCPTCAGGDWDLWIDVCHLAGKLDKEQEGAPASDLSVDEGVWWGEAWVSWMHRLRMPSLKTWAYSLDKNNH